MTNPLELAAADSRNKVNVSSSNPPSTAEGTGNITMNRLPTEASSQSQRRTVNFSITESQFNAMQDQVRSKLGMTTPMIGNHSH